MICLRFVVLSIVVALAGVSTQALAGPREAPSAAAAQEA